MSSSYRIAAGDTWNWKATPSTLKKPISRSTKWGGGAPGEPARPMSTQWTTGYLRSRTGTRITRPLLHTRLRLLRLLSRHNTVRFCIVLTLMWGPHPAKRFAAADGATNQAIFLLVDWVKFSLTTVVLRLVVVLIYDRSIFLQALFAWSGHLIGPIEAVICLLCKYFIDVGLSFVVFSIKSNSV